MVVCTICDSPNLDAEAACPTCNPIACNPIGSPEDRGGAPLAVSEGQGLGSVPGEGYSPAQLAGYGDLKRVLDQAGILARQPGYYTYKILSTLLMLAVGVTVLAMVESFWLRLIDAVFLAFVFGQIGLVGHDAGHYGIFRSTGRNKIAGLVVCFLIGMVRSWWVEKHNRHHTYPNDLSRDPDSDIPLLAFTEGQARSKRGFYRLVVRWQAFFFLPMLALEGFGLRLAGIQYVLREIPRVRPGEILIVGAHYLVYPGLLFYFLNPWQVLMFIVVHQLLFGLYVGSIFAPNHKGMPVIEKGDQMDFVRQQVITARNVKSHPLTDFWYGGLNYQIEHHLFPSMPRNKLSEAQKHVKAFCLGLGIPYTEATLVGSQREILQYLHRVSRPLRGGRVLSE